MLWLEGCLAVLVRSYLFKQGIHLFARAGPLPGHINLALTKLWYLHEKLGTMGNTLTEEEDLEQMPSSSS